MRATEVEDERRLVERVRNGDEGAFEALFRAYYVPLTTFAMRYVGARADAEETAQDVFSAMWVRRATVEVRESVRAYLYGAVRRRALTRAALPDHEQARLERLSRIPAYAPDRVAESPEAVIERAELRANVARAVAALPRRQREVFALRADSGLRYAEIAEILGTSVKNVEVALRRAVHTLRQVLPEFFA